MPIAESTGWYYPDGRPCLEVPSADGKKLVKPTVTHARKLGLLMSVTNVLKIKANYGLTAWMKEQERAAAWKLLGPGSDRTFESYEQFSQDCASLAHEYPQESADTGKAIHAGVEGLVRGDEIAETIQPYAKPVYDYLRGISDDWVPEQTFVHTGLQYAGRVDLYSERLELVVDLKTRSFESEAAGTKIKPYDEEPMQLMAYARGLGFGKEIRSIYISREKPGLFTVYDKYSEKESLLAWESFVRLLAVAQMMGGLPCPQVEGI